MVSDIISFLSELQKNNNRVWFQENKERYDGLRQLFIQDVQKLIDRISLFDPEVSGMEAKDCLFRIYRDIRFSPNKLPYKSHFAAYIARGAGRATVEVTIFISNRETVCCPAESGARNLSYSKCYVRIFMITWMNLQAF